MRALEIWHFIHRYLACGEAVALLIVVDSQGSSPGRLGFKMAVAADGDMVGSIGGGIMEHKLVAWAEDRLRKQLPFWETRRQIHSKEAPHDQSGMICSGEQTIALLCLSAEHLAVVTRIIQQLDEAAQVCLNLEPNGLFASTAADDAQGHALQQITSEHWSYREILGKRDVAHVIGAGHVGLEMCKVLANLDFFVINYDDRPGLNTMEANAFAHRKLLTPYAELHRHIAGGPDVYVIVMTFGYRGDNEAVRALLGQEYAYFGMMGSQSKVDKLLADLRTDGYPAKDIAQLHTPAGLVSHCKSPAEIAISIAAEIIQIRNQG